MKKIGNNILCIIKLILIGMLVEETIFLVLFRKYIDDWKEYVELSFGCIFVLFVFLFADTWLRYDDRHCVIEHVFWKDSFFLHEIVMVLPGSFWGMYRIRTYYRDYIFFSFFAMRKLYAFFDTIEKTVPSVYIMIDLYNWYKSCSSHFKKRHEGQ